MILTNISPECSNQKILNLHKQLTKMLHFLAVQDKKVIQNTYPEITISPLVVAIPTG